MAYLMNEKFWLANKAKTLTDKGDKVSEALALWDKSKKFTKDNLGGGEQKLVIDNLSRISKECTVLKKTANSVVHKETIKILDFYIQTSQKSADIFEKADGAILFNSVRDLNIPKSVIDDLSKSFSGKYWLVAGDCVPFLIAIKKCGGKANAQLFNQFVKRGAPNDVNSASSQEPIEKLFASAADPWEHGDWNLAKKELIGCVGQLNSQQVWEMMQGKPLPVKVNPSIVAKMKKVVESDPFDLNLPEWKNLITDVRTLLNTNLPGIKKDCTAFERHQVLEKIATL